LPSFELLALDKKIDAVEITAHFTLNEFNKQWELALKYST